MSKKLAIMSTPPKAVDSPGGSAEYVFFDMKDPLRKVKKLKKDLENCEKEETKIRDQVRQAYDIYNGTIKTRKCCSRFAESVQLMLDNLAALDLGAVRLKNLKLNLPSNTDIAKAERFSLQQKTGKSGKQRGCKEASVLREKKFYENIIQKTKDWMEEAEKKIKIMGEFREPLSLFVALCETYTIPLKELGTNFTMTTTTTTTTSRLISAEGGVLETSCTIPSTKISASVDQDKDQDDKTVWVTAECCEECKAALLTHQIKEGDELVPVCVGAEGDHCKESKASFPQPITNCNSTTTSITCPNKPKISGKRTWEENIKSHAWWNTEESGGGEKSAEMATKNDLDNEEEDEEDDEEEDEEYEEVQENPELDDLVEVDENGAEVEGPLEDDEDWESDIEEEEVEEGEDDDETKSKSLLQQFKEFSNNFKLPEFNKKEKTGKNCRNAECQTDFVDVDDDELYEDLDPSIPLFEIEENASTIPSHLTKILSGYVVDRTEYVPVF